MIEILDNYCKNPNGLLLFNPPTGTGKTHNVLEWIYRNYKQLNKEGRKIFFITNLKKNLPYEKLKREFFKRDNRLDEFEKDVIFINSNYESLLNNFGKVKIDNFFRELPVYNQLKNNIEEIIKISKEINSNRGYYNKLVKDLREDLEPKFRDAIEKYINKNYKGKKDKIKAVSKGGPLSWVGELYPAVLSSKKKIFFLSIDKFYYKNSTLIEPSYSFLEHGITKNAIVFIDEFDATKDNLLSNIIENGSKQQIDFIQLFSTIYWALSNKELPSKFTIYSGKEKDVKRAEFLRNAKPKLSGMAQEIVEKYNVDHSFKSQDENVSSKRNLLFHDFQYHSVYRNDKKFTHLNFNEEEKINEISFVDKKPQTGDNIVVILNQIKGFVNYFSAVVKEIAENYLENENLARGNNDFQTEFTYEHAINSVLEEFGLEGRYKQYIKENILHGKSTNKKKNREDELNYDLSIYENGFRYYDFVDDDNHQTKTKIYLYAFHNTPEKFIVKLTERAMVVGISATALIETVTGNYDINYFKRKLGESYYELNTSEKDKLRDLFNLQNRNYDKINIKPAWIGYEGRNENIDEFTELLEDSELAHFIINKIKNENGKSSSFHFGRYYKISYCFKQFLKQDDIRGYLCLLNKEPKNGDRDLNLEILQEIFSILIEETVKKEELFKNEKGEFDATKSFIIINSTDFEEKKTYFTGRLQEGNKIFIISTYATMGAGQNIQYIAPDVNSLINIQDSSCVNWNTNNETDINAIYLDKPTHVIQNININLTEEGFVRYIFQLEFLHQVGLISKLELNNQVTTAFKKLEKEKENNKKNNFSSNLKLYRDDNVKSHHAKIVIQAIGRICRTNLKSANIYINADKDLDEMLKGYDVENNIVLNEFKALVESCNSSSNPEDLSLIKLENLAESTNKKVHTNIKMFLNNEWKWDEDKKAEWEKLRLMCLCFPSLSHEEFETKNLNRIKDYYIELPEESDKYYYSVDEQSDGYEYEKVDISFNPKANSVIDENYLRLKDLMAIPGVRVYFEKNKWATEMKRNKYFLPPVLMNNIYKGALGEQVGKFVFEKELGIFLEDLPLEHYELFDYKIPGKDVYIDFKHWKESTSINASDQLNNILSKLDKVNGEKVYIINIITSGGWSKTVHSNGRVVEIPYIWNTEKREFSVELKNEFKRYGAL